MKDEADEIDEIKRRMLEGMAKQSYPSEPLRMDERSFEQTLSDYPVVVVDCYADWCAPCRMMSPMIKELSREFQGKIVFGKVNIDESREIAVQFGVQSIPTLLIFKENKLVDRVIGVVQKDRLAEHLLQYVQQV
ncbi:MAG TPA: thioredoxin [Thermoplasmata archaeon]|nr:thioredoxin [Thermoplasmata archaeon]